MTNHLARLLPEDILAHGWTTRWHTAPTRRAQSLAEHVAKVAMIAAKLADALDPKPEPEELLALIQDCLLHDAPEVIYGDLPNPGKLAINAFTGMDLDSNLEARFWGATDRGTRPVPTHDTGLLGIRRLADILEATTFYWTEGAPGTRRAYQILRECSRAIQDYPSRAVREQAVAFLWAAEVPIQRLPGGALVVQEEARGEEAGLGLHHADEMNLDAHLAGLRQQFGKEGAV